MKEFVPRVALALPGQPRTMEFCYPSQKKIILDHYHPDVFICSDEQEEKISSLYKPTKAEFYSQSYIDRQVGKRDYKLANWLAGWIFIEDELSCAWKFLKCAEMIGKQEAKNGRNYDVVMFTRFDLKVLSVQPLWPIMPRTIYTPKKGGTFEHPDKDGLHYGGYSAHIAWGDSDTMKTVMTGLISFDDYYKEVGEWAAEKQLKWWCDKNGISRQFANVYCMIIRGTSDKPRAFNYWPLEKYPDFL